MADRRIGPCAATVRLFVACLVVLGAVLASPRPSAAKRKRSENLMSVITPVHRGVTTAHPWINLRVRFGQASDGSPADLSTFKAKFGRCKLPSDLFEDVVENGVVVAKRVRLMTDTLRRCRLKTGGRVKNKLKLKVRATRRKLKDTDKVHFGVLESENHPPMVDISAQPDVIGDGCESPDGVAVQLSARGQPDPDDDLPVRFEWDLGDGSTATGESVTHTYTGCASVTVSLRAFDEDPANGGKSVTVERTLPAIPALDPGRVPGVIRLTSSGRANLDFGTVAVGQVATRTFTVHNDAAAFPTTQVKFTVDVLDDTAPFSVECPPEEPACDVGGAERPVSITFAPTSEGHAEAVLQLVSTGSNLPLIRLLVHGYGGTGSPPWGTTATGYIIGPADLPRDVVGAKLPDGTLVPLDNSTALCVGGTVDGAPCVTGNDCAGGGTCPERLCFSGPNQGQSCSSPSDCPESTCGDVFEPIDLCADGTGTVYMLNDDVRFDPNPDRDPQESGMILRVDTGGARSVLTDRVTEETLTLACDRRSDGRVFWTHYDLDASFDDREDLKTLKKDGGSITTLLQNINRRMGDVDPQTYIESDGFINYGQSLAMRADANGNTVYISNTFGLYRVEPSPLLVTRDVDEVFDVFPDGSLLAAAAIDDNLESTIRVYKIDPNHAVTGTLVLDALTPWATASVPINRGPCPDPCRRTTFINRLAVAPDGIVFVNLFTVAGGREIESNLRVRGTLRFEPVGDGSTGEPTGFLGLEILDRVTF
jgi:hypothetical protein